MLLDVVTIAPAGVVPATFICPTNGAKLHVTECVWASEVPKREVLEHGVLTLKYRKTLSQAELLALQVSGQEAMAAMVFPVDRSGISPGYLQPTQSRSVGSSHRGRQ